MATENTPAIMPVDRSADGLILAWLHSHLKDSARTASTYGEFLAGLTWQKPRLDGETGAWRQRADAQSFRRYAQASGWDLLPFVPARSADESSGDYAARVAATAKAHRQAIGYLAQAWAAEPHQRTGKAVTPATHNLRLAAVASFYDYAISHEEMDGPNPLATVQRMKRQQYTGARALPFADGALDAAIAAIPKDSQEGMRDRALLSLALYTGRRLAEIADLRCGDIASEGGQLVITWRHMKGGKQGRNVLTAKCPAVAHLVRWLDRYYGTPWRADGLAFPALSRNNAGGRMSAQGIEGRAAKWLGVSKFHALRHTFAMVLLKAGASPVEIQEALGHSSLAVTSVYLESLGAGENQHLGAMAAIYAGHAPRRQGKQRSAS